MNNKDKELYLYKYCENSMSNLKKLCNNIICKIGGISQKDYDDIYSLGQFVLLESLNNYDESKNKNFDSYLKNNLNNRLYYTYIRNMNRKKRKNVVIDKEGNVNFSKDISLNSDRIEDLKIIKSLKSKYDVEVELFTENNSFDYSNEMKKYLENLSKLQFKILMLIVENYSSEEIKKELNISTKVYLDNLKAIKSYENTKHILNLN